MSGADRLTDMFSLINPGSHDSVGARIRLLRNKRGLTQQELADEIGVSRSAVALWETDRGGEAQHLPRIAEALGVSIDFFINGMASHNVNASLSADEHALVLLYRGCDAPDQLSLLRTAGRLMRKGSRQVD
jgi:transcriptional regulator with XRE-family HTH domain